MTTIIKTRIHYLITAGLLIALLFCIQRCHRAESLSKTNLNAITDTLKHYKNALGTKTATIQTLQLNNNQLEEIVLSKNRELAALSSGFRTVSGVTQFKTITKFDTITIKYRDTVPCLFKRKGTLKTDWYNFQYTSNQKGIYIDSLSLPNTTTVIIGNKRKWFLGKETLTTEITHSNPYVETQQLTSAVVVSPVPVYRKWYVWLGAGIAGGFLLAK